MAEEIPASVPHSIETGALDRAKKVISDPVGVPVHHTTVEAHERFESIEQATGLDPDYQWFCLGLAYCLIKVDRSLFEVYKAAGNLEIPIKTHRASQSIVEVVGSNYSQNPWSATVQGIPKQHGRNFIDFAASYQFSRNDTGDLWCCDFVELRCADPLVEHEKHGINIWFALPRNMTKKRHMSLIQEPGLLLGKPILGVSTDG